LKIDLAYDMAVVGDFADKGALLRYFKHPAVQGAAPEDRRAAASRVSVDYSAP
ncbi:MAG: Dabb family protein, partial [Dehalococcoidia bacterium]|nr:Dabb family protein [Dehalococcoidia bacterium]